MRALLAMIIANIKMSFRNTGAIFWNLLFPAIFIVIFGLIFGNESNIVFDVGLTGADSQYRQAATGAFTGSEAFDVSESTDRATLFNELDDGDISAVIEFGEAPAGGLPPVTVHYSRENGPTAEIVTSVVRQVLVSVASAETPLNIAMEPVSTNEMSFIGFFVPGIVAMSLMNSGVIGLSTTFTSWRERGILRRMRLTPFPLPSFLLARILSQLVVAFTQSVILIGLGAALFGYRPNGNLLVMVIAVIFVALAFLSIGFAVSAVARTTESAAGIANLIVFPMLFLSGIFFQTDSAPSWLKPITDLLPLRFAVDALRGAMTRGYGLGEIWQELLVLTGFFLVALAFSVRFFKWDSR
jgi:ABC-2 type transport system permease protein